MKSLYLTKDSLLYTCVFNRLYIPRQKTYHLTWLGSEGDQKSITLGLL